MRSKKSLLVVPLFTAFFGERLILPLASADAYVSALDIRSKKALDVVGFIGDRRWDDDNGAVANDPGGDDPLLGFTFMEDDAVSCLASLSHVD